MASMPVGLDMSSIENPWAQFGTKTSNLGQDIAKIGNASSGAITSPVPTGAPMPTHSSLPQIAPTPTMNGAPTVAPASGGSVGSNVPITPPMTPMGGVAPVPGGPISVGPQPPTSAPPTGTPPSTMLPMGAGTPIGVTSPNPVNTNIPYTDTQNHGQLTDIYGPTGDTINTLLGEETPGSANALAQQIIQANAPNVARGAANLNTGLAAGGISPSSSVSAIENANYGAQVAQQDEAEIAQVNMQEQQMQQQLLESLMPSAQQQHTDSSGWSIFGDVMSGIGDIFSL